MGPPKNQKGVRVWTGTRLIELESHELILLDARLDLELQLPLKNVPELVVSDMPMLCAQKLSRS